MKKICNLVFLFTVLILIPALLTAQTGQVGSIKGTVTADDGTALPGVGVTLKSPALVIGKMTMVTNLSGNYRFVSLPPGTYELSFEMEGMDTFIRRGIVINANFNINVAATMHFKTVQEQIVVEGKAPTIDVRTVAKTTTLDKQLLSSLPASRNLSAYVNMTPGINSNSSGTSSQGASVRDNSYNVDGVQFNDPVVGTSNSKAFSIDIMDEVSIQTGGLSAEYGSAKGAVINVVTKSGGNEFSGSLSCYYNDLSLMSDNTQKTRLKGSLTGPKYEYEPGLTFGGPLAKDKLWFFLNLSTFRSARYYAGFPYDKPAKTVPIKDNNLMPYLKLTYQPDQNNKFVVAFNYTRRDIDHDGADQWQNEDTTTTFKSPNYTVSLQWARNFGTNFMTNLNVGYFQTGVNWYVHKQAESYTNYDEDGRLENSYGWDDLSTRKRLQANLDGTYFVDNLLGSHELKFGIQSTYGLSHTQRPLYGPKDAKGFTRVWNYISDGVLYYAEWFNGYDSKSAVLNAGVFINDSWNIGKHLTLNLGLRYDYSSSILPKQGDPTDPLSRGDFGYIGHPEVTWDMIVPKTKTFYTWNNFSPRIGLVYDLFADGKTILKANFSRYLQANYTSIAFELNPVNWVGYGYYVTPEGVPTDLDYTYTTGVNTKIGYGDYKLKTPYTNEYTVGIERELFSDWTVGLTYIRKADRNLIEDVDASALDIDKLMNQHVFDWINYEPFETVDPYDGKTVTFWNQKEYVNSVKYIVNPPDAKRDYSGVELTLRKRYAQGWSLGASYVYAKSTGLIGQSFWDSEGRTGFYNNPNAHVNVDAKTTLGMERRHQFKVEALVKAPLGIDLSTYFRYLSGYPVARWLNSVELDLPLYKKEWVIAEKMGSHKLPDTIVFDLRLAKNFRLGTKVGMQVFCDVFNLFNNNKATEVMDRSTASRTKFMDMTTIQDPRIFRLGFKINFN